MSEEYGGGGGYGCGGRSPARGLAKGGNIYGNAAHFELNGKNVYLGSGGGCGGDQLGWYYGGNGGGAVVIYCDDAIIIEKGCTISANGSKNEDGAGGGSGGSIYLHAPIIVNNGTVTAIGGSPNYGGSGGIGRIRVDCNNYFHQQLTSSSNFNPPIEYFGCVE